MVKINTFKLIAIILVTFTITGCSGEVKKRADSKNSQNSVVEQKNNNEMLNFSAEVIDEGKKLINAYENKEQKYSLRYSADWDYPVLDEDGDAFFYYSKGDDKNFSNNISITTANESDAFATFMSADMFAKMVETMIQNDGTFDKVQIVRSEKNKVNADVQFFVEFESKDKKNWYFTQQYYFIKKDKFIILTATFSVKEDLKKYEKEVQSMASSIRF